MISMMRSMESMAANSGPFVVALHGAGAFPNLDRPRALKIPTFAMKMLGDLGEELMTGSWVVPAKLEAAGYEWRDPELEPALRRLLT